MKTGSAGRVLILDDDVDLLNAMTIALETANIEVFATTSVFELPYLLSRHDPDVVLVGLGMPALAIARERMRTDARFILFSGRGPDELSELTDTILAHGFLAKTDEVAHIIQRIKLWVRERRTLSVAAAF